jgi:hypothetical protein
LAGGIKTTELDAVVQHALDAVTLNIDGYDAIRARATDEAAEGRLPRQFWDRS